MGYSRDIAGSVGPEVSSSYPEAPVNLVLALGTVVLNVSVLGFDVVGVQISDGWNVGVRNLAVVAFVVVIGQNLPVEVTLHVPSVIEVVVVEIVVVETRLLVNTVKVVLPGNLGGLLGIKIDPDKAITIDMHMDGCQLIVVKVSLDFSLVILGDNELVAGSIVLDPVAGIGDTVLVCGEEPFAREDRSSLKLVHVLGGIPGSGKSADRRLLLLLDLGGRGGGTKEIPQERHCEYKGIEDAS